MQIQTTHYDLVTSWLGAWPAGRSASPPPQTTLRLPRKVMLSIPMNQFLWVAKGWLLTPRS